MTQVGRARGRARRETVGPAEAPGTEDQQGDGLGSPN